VLALGRNANFLSEVPMKSFFPENQVILQERLDLVLHLDFFFRLRIRVLLLLPSCLLWSIGIDHREKFFIYLVLG